MVWNWLRSQLRRWRRPRRQVVVELTPSEQIIVRYLLHFGQGSEDDLLQEVANERWFAPHQLLTDLVNLQVKGLIVRTGGESERGTLFKATHRSQAVRDILPSHPTSSLAVYLTVDEPAPPRSGRPDSRPRWPL